MSFFPQQFTSYAFGNEFFLIAYQLLGGFDSSNIFSMCCLTVGFSETSKAVANANAMKECNSS